jgi:hypothetical protein
LSSAWSLAQQQQRKEAGEMIDNDANAAYRAQVKKNYDFSEWAGQTKEGNGDVGMFDFFLATEDFKEWKLVEQEDLPASTRQRRIVRYVFNSGGQGWRLVSTMFECKSVLDAHESLIDVVMTYMARKLPRCGTKGMEIGDICFAGHGDMTVSVIFARFNILTEIQSVGSEPASVDGFARSVDEMVLERYQENR